MATDKRSTLPIEIEEKIEEGIEAQTTRKQRASRPIIGGGQKIGRPIGVGPKQSSQEQPEEEAKKKEKEKEQTGEEDKPTEEGAEEQTEKPGEKTPKSKTEQVAEKAEQAKATIQKAEKLAELAKKAAELAKTVAAIIRLPAVLWGLAIFLILAIAIPLAIGLASLAVFWTRGDGGQQPAAAATAGSNADIFGVSQALKDLDSKIKGIDQNGEKILERLNELKTKVDKSSRSDKEGVGKKIQEAIEKVTKFNALVQQLLKLKKEGKLKDNTNDKAYLNCLDQKDGFCRQNLKIDKADFPTRPEVINLLREVIKLFNQLIQPPSNWSCNRDRVRDTDDGSDFMRFGKPETIDFLTKVCDAWLAQEKEKVGVGDLSNAEGGNNGRHAEHTGGTDADLFAKNVMIAPRLSSDLPYDQTKAVRFANLLIGQGAGRIIQGDPELPSKTSNPNIVITASDHRDHWHVDIP